MHAARFLSGAGKAVRRMKAPPPYPPPQACTRARKRDPGGGRENESAARTRFYFFLSPLRGERSRANGSGPKWPAR
jgi:hypothetical protein